MDLKAIKEKLEKLNNSGQQDRPDYSKMFWKPSLGKQTIRIVPSAYDPTFPFSELKFHYGVGKYPMIALSNFGKQDPIEEFVKELKKTSDKDNWSLAGKLTPKTRVYAPVIVRGEEDQGVRLWGFGVTIYKSLLALAEDEDIGDYTDVVNGWDLVVEQRKGNPYPETSVRIKPKQTPLSDDNTEVSVWLKEQPNPLEAFLQFDYEYIKKKLQEYLEPGSEEEESEGEDEKTSQPSEPAKKYSTDTAGSKGSGAVDKFDSLFNS